MQLSIVTSSDDIEGDTLAFLDVRKDANIELSNGDILYLDYDVGRLHTNYRVSAVASDMARKLDETIGDRALRIVKGLDIIVSSLPERLNDVSITRNHLIETLPQHHYFKGLVESNLTVYTGIAMNKITDIDLHNLTYKMDFYLWFRYTDTNISVDNIEFTNTLKPSMLLWYEGSSISQAKKVEDEVKDGLHYIRYHVIGEFKGIEFKNYALGEQNLPIVFRHVHLPLCDIHYVNDFIHHDGVFTQNIPTTTAELEKSRFDIIDASELYLNYTLPYSTFTHKALVGEPASLSDSLVMSSYTMRYAIKHVQFSVRGIESYINSLFPLGEGRIHVGYMTIYVLFSIMVNLLLSRLRRKRILKSGWSHVAWIINLLVIFAMLLSIEFLSSELIFELKASVWAVDNLDIIDSIMEYLELVIALLWWVIPAYYINSALDQFIYCPIEERTKTEIPHVLRMFVMILIYVLALIGILAYVFEVTTSSLMATSGAFAILFAILSKVDISNIVAGLGISFAKVFKLGDWVKIDGIEGQVVEMTPRSTKILTFTNSIVNIPNTNVGSAVIENMEHPNNAYRLFIHLEIVPMEIEFVERILLNAVETTEDILDYPKPFIAFLGQGDSAQIFEVYFFISDYSKIAYMQQLVWRSVWNACESNRIEMSTPQREHFNYMRDE
jgi:branched-chain amino acid transport system substrate-binding protein